MKIIVEAETMRSNAMQIRNEKAKFEETINQMRTIVNSMSGAFEGEAATAYVNNFESFGPTFAQFGELIESFASKLDAAAVTFSEADHLTAGQMSGN